MEVPQLGAVVELRDGLEGFYDGAKAGWRAIVKDHKKDDYGFDVIYVEWDKDYWRYEPNGQKDGWVFPAHFNVVGQKTDADLAADAIQQSENRPEDVIEIPASLPEKAERTKCPGCGQYHDEEGDQRRLNYLRLLNAAANEAAEGEAFALFFVKRDLNAQGVVEVVPYTFIDSLTDEGQALLDAQIVKVAGMCTDKFIIEYMRKFL